MPNVFLFFCHPCLLTKNRYKMLTASRNLNWHCNKSLKSNCWGLYQDSLWTVLKHQCSLFCFCYSTLVEATMAWIWMRKKDVVSNLFVWIMFSRYVPVGSVLLHQNEKEKNQLVVHLKTRDMEVPAINGWLLSTLKTILRKMQKLTNYIATSENEKVK